MQKDRSACYDFPVGCEFWNIEMFVVNDRPPAADPILMDILEGRFSTPSGNYFWHRKRQKVLALFKRYLQQFPPQANQPLLVELGCGQAIDLFLMRDAIQAQQPEWQYIGVEGTPTLLELNNTKKQWLNAQNVEFVPADLTKRLPFEDNSVDLVYTSEVIEHLAHPEAYLTEVRRILKKPNGCLLLTTPNEPNVFQKTYWHPKRYQALQAEMLALRQKHDRVESLGSSDSTETDVAIYGHISLRKISEWEKTLHQLGYESVASARGAMVYGATAFWDQEWLMGLRFLSEAILDLLPVSIGRHFSDQLIGLYRAGFNSY